MFRMTYDIIIIAKQRRAMAARKAHNLEAGGSIPSAATIRDKIPSKNTQGVGNS